MCVKLLPGDLNPDPYPSHPTSTYTCGVTIAPRVCGGDFLEFFTLSPYCPLLVIDFGQLVKNYFFKPYML